MDDAIISKFPSGAKIISVVPHGKSEWTQTTLLVIALNTGSQEKCFLKCTTSENGCGMMKGEFNSMSELYKIAPDFVPKPYGWGSHRSVDGEETHFLLQEFIEMTTHDLPDPEKLCSKLATLHKDSFSAEYFGFHINTFQGHIPQAVNTRFSTWTPFFTHILKYVTELDMKVNGTWNSLATLECRVFIKVIPRLVGALENGRTIKPCLIHGDLWEGNIGTSISTGEIVLFDAASYYAHHEMEIADWRCHYNKIHDEIYTKTYLKYHEPSEPKEEWMIGIGCIVFTTISFIQSIIWIKEKQ